MENNAGNGVRSRIYEFEKEIHLNDEEKGEVAAAFSADGRLMCFFAGLSATMVDEAECPPARGSILTHNHISDAAFSLRDLKTAAELGLIEMRVVGPSGWHSMKPGPEGWPSPAEISREYSRISQEVSGLPGGNMSEATALICERLADDLGLVYERGFFEELLD